MRKLSIALSLALLPLSTLTAFADGVIILANPTAAQSNFGGGPTGDPGSTALVGYSINISDNGSSLVARFTSTLDNRNGLHFANGYFDTVANNGQGSNIGFEFTNNRVFIPGVDGYYSLAGTGYSFTDTFDTITGQETIEALIPNSFFLNDPLGLGYSLTPPGTAVSLHLSQTFSYSVVGGNANFPAPKELGQDIIPAAGLPSTVTPEPSTLVLLSTGILGMIGAVRRRLVA